MSTLREASIGPIIGHTTDTSCRLWIRGADSGDHKSQLSEAGRTVGVLSVVAENDTPIPMDSRPAFYFRLHREYDRTGTFNLGVDHSFKTSRAPRDKRCRRYVLQPDTTYEVRLGSLSIDDSGDNDEMVASGTLADRLPPPTVWCRELDRLERSRSLARFTTFPEPSKPAASLRFLLGSCRYPGLAWKRKHSDRIFGPMYQEFRKPADGKSPHFTLMVGDQIYADMFNRLIPIGLADTYEEFQERYHSAFGSLHMRRLLRNAPTYMILDDHEIEDNWTQDRIRKRKKRLLFNIAIGAYCSYQWSHGPRSYGRRLYYQFECGGYPFFVLDGRTQRYKDDDPDLLEDNYLLGRPSFRGDDPSQLENLCSWMKKQQVERGNAPKFIVSASVFAPNSVNSTKGDKQRNASDSWPAFPSTRKAILDTTVSHGIQNVVFLSGDIHCSNVARMWFSGTPEAEKIKAYSITSSAFYWPFFFADGEPSDFVHKSTDKRTPDTFHVNSQVTMDYEAFNFTQEDNYCQVNVSKAKHNITVLVKDNEGNSLLRRRHPQLDLAPW